MKLFILLQLNFINAGYARLIQIRNTYLEKIAHLDEEHPYIENKIFEREFEEQYNNKLDNLILQYFNEANAAIKEANSENLEDHERKLVEQFRKYIFRREHDYYRLLEEMEYNRKYSKMQNETNKMRDQEFERFLENLEQEDCEIEIEEEGKKIFSFPILKTFIITSIILYVIILTITIKKMMKTKKINFLPKIYLNKI